MTSILMQNRPPCAICLRQDKNPDITTYKCVRCRQVEMCRDCLEKYEKSSFQGRCPICKYSPRNMTWYEEIDIEQGVLDARDEPIRVFITESAVNDFIYRLLKTSFLFILGCMGAYFVGFAHTETFIGANSPQIVVLRIVLGILLIAVYILIAISSLIMFTGILVLCLKSYNSCQ